MIAVTRLLQMFPFDGDCTALAKRFNDQAAADLERIRDFIVLHYVLTERDDTAFWRRARTMAIPDTLRERIALFRDNAMAYQEGEELFRVDSWVQVMIGQGVVPRHHHRMGAIMGDARLRQVLDDMRAQVARQVATLPAHQAFLERYCPYPR